MGLVPLNCYAKISANLPRLLSLQPDVAVLREAVNPLPSAGITWLSNEPVADNPKHIVALAQAPWSVVEHPLADVAPAWGVAVRHLQPVSFDLLAVNTIKWVDWPSYPARLRSQIITETLPKLDRQVLVAGDFHAPIPSMLKAHARNDAELQEAGLRSAFLHARSVDVRTAYLGEAPAAQA